MSLLGPPKLLHPVVRELLVLLRDDNAATPEAFQARLDELELRVQSEGAPHSTIEAIRVVKLIAHRRDGFQQELGSR